MSNLWKAVTCLGLVILALSARCLASDMGTRPTPPGTKAPFEDELVLAEDFGLGIRVGTPEADVISRLGEPEYISDYQFVRSICYGPYSLVIDIRKPSHTISTVFVFDVQDDWIKERRMSLFGKPIHKVTLDYLKSVLPTGKVEDTSEAYLHLFNNLTFSWQSARVLPLPYGYQWVYYMISAEFRDGVIDMVVVHAYPL